MGLVSRSCVQGLDGLAENAAPDCIVFTRISVCITGAQGDALLFKQPVCLVIATTLSG
jgi:hypothetical protein